MALKNALTEPLRSSNPAEVLERSLEKGRLPHAMLLHGDHYPLLEELALGLASVLLDINADAQGGSERFDKVEKHPDFFPLRPSKKARSIRAEDTREIIRQVQQSPHQAERKVVVIYEADRLGASSQSASANIILKTLEEPPLDTTIVLISTRPYSLLDTIRSRCFNFRVPAPFEPTSAASWKQWLDDYSSFLNGLTELKSDKKKITSSFMMIYGLIARFSAILTELVSENWKTEREKLPEDMSDEEKDATKEGSAKGIRAKLLKEIEHQTRETAAPYLKGEKEGDITLKFTDSVQQFEQVIGLLNVNLKEETALEDYFLSCMRIWTR
ncbi:MAG: DNA polymerase III subunit gamma/tau [Opitutales bacterium]|nr:DNA polymerase III subunit gamma/tau [bacterium]MDG2168510.1 DNA polymerase III subunit gamma/tau [Opitutales bacterium]